MAGGRLIRCARFNKSMALPNAFRNCGAMVKALISTEFRTDLLSRMPAGTQLLRCATIWPLARKLQIIVILITIGITATIPPTDSTGLTEKFPRQQQIAMAS